MIYVYDDFIGIAGQSLLTRLPSLGAGYLNIPPRTGTFTLNGSGKVSQSTSNLAAVYCATFTETADYLATVTIDFPATLLSFAAVVMRAAGSVNTEYFFGMGTNTLAFIIKIVNGVQTTIQQVSVASVANTTKTLLFAVSGTSLKGYINGTLVCNATDSAVTAMGHAGLWCNNGISPTLTFSKFRVYDTAGDIQYFPQCVRFLSDQLYLPVATNLNQTWAAYPEWPGRDENPSFSLLRRPR